MSLFKKKKKNSAAEEAESIQQEILNEEKKDMIGKTVDRLTSLVDLPPTLLRAAGISVPDAFPGFPLQSLAEDPEVPLREEVYVQISEAGDGRAIRTEGHTYCAMFDGGDLREAYVYDNLADPYQRRNLAGLPEYADLRAELRRRLEAAVLREEERAYRGEGAAYLGLEEHDGGDREVDERPLDDEG